MRKCALFLGAIFLFSGCGGKEAKPTVITPVDGIKQNIDIGDSLKKSVKESAKANSATEDQLKKK